MRHLPDGDAVVGLVLALYTANVLAPRTFLSYVMGYGSLIIFTGRSRPGSPVRPGRTLRRRWADSLFFEDTI